MNDTYIDFLVSLRVEPPVRPFTAEQIRAIEAAGAISRGEAMPLNLQCDLYTLFDRVTRGNVQRLRQEVLCGQIHGSHYGNGDPTTHACIIGKLSAIAGYQHYWQIWDRWHPVEEVVRGVRPGHTPATSPALAQVLSILDTYLMDRASVPAGELVLEVCA